MPQSPRDEKRYAEPEIVTAGRDDGGQCASIVTLKVTQRDGARLAFLS